MSSHLYPMVCHSCDSISPLPLREEGGGEEEESLRAFWVLLPKLYQIAHHGHGEKSYGEGPFWMGQVGFQKGLHKDSNFGRNNHKIMFKSGQSESCVE